MHCAQIRIETSDRADLGGDFADTYPERGARNRCPILAMTFGQNRSQGAGNERSRHIRYTAGDGDLVDDAKKIRDWKRGCRLQPC